MMYHPTSNSTPSEASHTSEPNAIQIGDHGFQPQADYIRVGNDLVVKFMGSEQVIADYFLPVQAPTLVGADGLEISPAYVQAHLVAQAEPVMVAGPASSAGMGKPIGNITTVVGDAESVKAERPDGNERALKQGDPIFLSDTISTGQGTYVKITLIDGTIFQLGPDSRASLNRYSYNSDEGNGHFDSTVFAGVFRFVSGHIADDNQGQHSVIRTPTATIGIRGSEIDGKIDSDGGTIILHMEGLIDIRPVYSLESFAVFEPGTRVYIPPVETSYSGISEQASQEFIFEFRSQLLPLNRFGIDSSLAPASKIASAVPQLLKPGENPLEPAEPGDGSPQGEAREGENENRLSYLQVDAERDVLRPELFGEKGKVVIVRGGEAEIELSEAQVEHFQAAENDLEDLHKYLDKIKNKDDQTDKDLDLDLVGLDGEGGGKTPPFAVDDQVTDKPEPGPEEQEPLPITVIQAVIAANSVTQVSLTQLIEQGLTLERLNQPEFGTLRLVNGVLEYTPQTNYLGADQFTYVLSDGTVVQVQLSIEGNPSSNPNPTDPNTSKSDFVIEEDQILSIPASALIGNAADAQGNPLSLHSVESTELTFGELTTGPFLNQVVFTPDSNYFGVAIFSYRLVDAAGNISEPMSASISVTPVNDAPQAVLPVVSILADAGESLTFTRDDLLSHVVDPDGDTLEIISLGAGINGSLALNEAGELVFTPNDGLSLQDNAGFTYTVSDGEAQTSVRILVQLEETANQAPQANQDSYTIPRGEDFVIAAADLLSNDTDADGDVLSIVSASKAVGGSIILDGETLTFTPNADFIKGGFSYTISDGEGGIASSTVLLSLENTAPVAKGDGIINDPSGEISISQTGSTLIQASRLLINDTDEDDDTLNILSVQKSINGEVSLTTDGNVLFTPDAGFADARLATFEYTVSDGHGGTSSASVRLLPLSTNTPPLALNDGGPNDPSGILLIQDSGSSTISAARLLANDADADGDTLTIVGVSNALNGTAILDTTTGDITFTPDSAFVNNGGGFTYSITDTQGATSTATVILSSSAVANTPPVAVGDGPITIDDTANTVISAAALLANDSDAEDTVLNIIGISSATNGTASLDINGDIVFTPDSNFANLGGNFVYIIEDSFGAQSSAQVTLTGSNQAPIANDDGGAFSILGAIYTTDGTPVVITEATMLFNDTDANGDSLEVTAINSVTNGTAVIDANGDVTFTPDSNFESTGSGSFQYIVTDSKGATNSAYVLITRSNQVPSAVADTVLLGAVTGAQIISSADLLANDSDPDGDTLSISAVTNAVNGTVAFDASGDIVFTPNAAFSASGGGFSYTINDGRGGTASSSVVVNYEGALVADDALSIAFNVPVLIGFDQLFANDPGAGLTMDSVLSNQAGVTVSLRSDGVAVYVDVSALGGAASASFNYTASNPDGQTDTAAVTLNSNNVQNGTVAADTLTGTDSNDILIGNAGNDILIGLAGNDLIEGGAGDDNLAGGTGYDEVYGDAGNDVLVIAIGDGPSLLDGGIGTDTLVLDDSSFTLDLISNSSLPTDQKLSLSGIDQIDLSAGSSNQLILSVSDVFDISDAASLLVTGNSTSSVTATGGWTNNGIVTLNGGAYSSYSSSGAELLISTDIVTQFVL